MARNRAPTPVGEIASAIADYRRQFDVTAGQGLSMWLAVRAFGFDPYGAYEAVQVDGGNDHGIDFFWRDDENSRVIVMQSKSSTTGKAKAHPKDLDELVNAHQILQLPEDLRREGRDDLASDAEEYLRAMDDDYDLEFWYVVMGSSTPEIRRKVHVFNQSDEARATNRFARFIDAELLASYAESASVHGDRIKKDRIAIDRRTRYVEKGAFGRALVATLRAAELARLYEVHGDRLFDSNVRLFLGSRKGSVNAGIRDTLADPGQRENFWAFNNGITIVTESFTGYGDRVTLSGFSIINGCQTTVSIANAADEGDLDGEVTLLARIIEPTAASVDDIIEFTNSQNPIKAWSRRSRDRTQRRLKQELADLDAPFFYSIRPGEKKTLTRAQRERFGGHGAFREIQADTVAQYLAALNGDPQNAYRDKGSLFRQRYRAVFPEDIQARDVLFAHVVGESADSAVRARLKQAREDDDDLHHRILRRGGKIYTIAALGIIAERRNGAGYRGQLEPAQIVSKAGKRRIEKYATQAAIWYVQFARAQMAHSDLSTLIRSYDFFPELTLHLRDTYDSMSQSQGWLDEALPRLGLR